MKLNEPINSLTATTETGRVSLLSHQDIVTGYHENILKINQSSLFSKGQFR